MIVSTGQLVFGFFASLVLSVFLVGVSLRYALWRGLLDVPGHRRSHKTPTARGGGLGLLLAAVPVVAWAWLTATPWLSSMAAMALLTGLMLLTLLGWLDDHHDLPSLPRFAVHLLASLTLAVVVVSSLDDWPMSWRCLVGAGLTLAAAWSINAHNFMDGIDSLLGMQALFYFLALGGLALYLGSAGVALACAGLAAASLGFLFYNRPPARIFMGDVGSGTLGWLVAALAAMLWREASISLWPALILSSTFIIDASLTLFRRIWQGRRWYTAHREHAYQWLVRSGLTHGQVTLFYLSWNLLVVLPLAVAALVWPWLAPGLLALTCVLGVGIYMAIRRYCYTKHDRRRRSAA